MEISANFSVNSSSILEPAFQPKPIVNDQLKEVLDVITHICILFFALLGVVTNSINMRVFIFQGFSDSNTVGLFFLAVADFTGCLFEIPVPACVLLPYFGLRQTYFACVAWITLVGLGTHLLMARINCLITVYIAVERCLCVLIPFKVKRLFRPRTTTISITFIYVMVIGGYSPLYMHTWVGSTFHPGLNATIPTLKQSNIAMTVGFYISFIFTNIVSNSAIIIVAIATGLMIFKLVESRKWRHNASAAKDDSQQKPTTAREKRELEVLKMVTMVTGLFIICTIMSQIPGMTIALIPGTTVTGINRNLFFVVFDFKIIFDLINSSLNYFFYVRISSKYKAAFKSVFGKNKLQK